MVKLWTPVLGLAAVLCAAADATDLTSVVAGDQAIPVAAGSTSAQVAAPAIDPQAVTFTTLDNAGATVGSATANAAVANTPAAVTTPAAAVVVVNTPVSNAALTPAAPVPVAITPAAISPAVVATPPAAAAATSPAAAVVASTPASANANANANTNANANANAPTTTTTSTAAATNPLVIKGYRFFDSVTGAYFGMRGVNYYPRPNTGALDANNLDLFTAQYAHIWQRDVPQFAALSANAIRVYAVDPDGDHTAFMCALQSAGIYVIVDLGSSCKGCEITADEAPACYPASYKTRGEKIIQNFSKYDNVIGFSGGNEINHRTGGNPASWNAPCQKKFVRDMRAYIKSCPSMRQIPVGLVMADTEREDNAKYYNCRTDPSDELENAEWYGINVYVHCSDSDDPAVGSGFDLLKQSFESYKYSIPTILTEYGCASKDFPTVDGYAAQRSFHDAKWMNSKRYSEFFNGGFAFEYTTENANAKADSPYPFKTYGPQNYGLGYLSPQTCDDVATNCSFVRFPNFHSLATAYKTTDTSEEPTLSTFQPAADRAKRTTCPTGWAKLKSLTWEGDAKASLTCPQITRYQCPNVALASVPQAFEAADMSSTSSASEESSPEVADTSADTSATPETSYEEAEASASGSAYHDTSVKDTGASAKPAVSNVAVALLAAATAAVLVL